MIHTGEALCPELYSRLVTMFGDVNVCRQGEAMSAHPSVFEDGKIDIDYFGEYYRVCCPMCGDDKKRLLINHRFWDFPYLAQCVNETACMRSREQRRNLQAMIFRGRVAVPMTYNRGEKVDGELRPINCPGNIIPLPNLPPDHPASRYLFGRGFNPYFLWNYFRVGWCESVDPNYSEYYPLTGRIYVPVWMRSQCVGWVGRRLEENDFGPKYYTMPRLRKSKVLYNFDAACQCDTVVVCEGCTDVWSYGTNAVAILGSSISMHQLSLLAAVWARRTEGRLVVCLDGDAKLKPRDERMLRDLFGDRMMVAELPADKDPGDFPNFTIRDLILEQAYRQGIHLSGFGGSQWLLQSLLNPAAN